MSIMSSTNDDVQYCESCDTYFTTECNCADDYEKFQMDLLKYLKDGYKMNWTDHRGEWELTIEKDGLRFIIHLEPF